MRLDQASKSDPSRVLLGAFKSIALFNKMGFLAKKIKARILLQIHIDKQGEIENKKGSDFNLMNGF